MKRLQELPIATQIAGLVILAVALTASAFIAIALVGPPNRQPPHRIEEMVAQLRGQAPLEPGMILHLEQEVSQSAIHLAASPRLVDEIAEITGSDTSEVLAFVADSRAPRRGEVLGEFLIAERTSESQWRTLESGPDKEFAHWQRITLLTVILVLVCILAISWLVGRQIVRPIQDLASAAKSSRAGSRWEYDIPSGPLEIAEAGLALDNLHKRNHEHMVERVTMLAAITHDIGTPLSRIAFRTENLPAEHREASLRDIDLIRLLLANSLKLARDQAGAKAAIDFAALCNGLVQAEADTGSLIEFDGPEKLEISGSLISLERMIQNLIENGLRFGDTVRLALSEEDDQVTLQVKDDGPGFPLMPQEELLKPFVRGEKSRNRESGGSGLGLAIVAKIVAAHDGAIQLQNSADGGALVRITLPKY